eukprot:GEZU01017111.1.p1 GENE.GEZU01017111.1~~GEZU01017111.1.p1  ORF type:complete len:106 (+),score=16.33 GEZU01017111.1:32-319(+)
MYNNSVRRFFNRFELALAESKQSGWRLYSLQCKVGDTEEEKYLLLKPREAYEIAVHGQLPDEFTELLPSRCEPQPSPGTSTPTSLCVLTSTSRCR